MKQIVSLALALVMAAALFTGCGCAANVSTEPHGMITDETSRPTIMPTPTATHETTQPHATMPTVTGSDPTDESTLPNSGSNGSNGGTGSMGGGNGGSGGTGSTGGGNGGSGGTGSTGGGIGGSGGTNGGTGNNESSMPTDTTTMPRNRNRNTAR